MTPTARQARRAEAIAVRVGQNVASHRGWLRMRQHDLARRARVDQSFVSLLERGKRLPSLDVLYAIRRALRCSWSDLLDPQRRRPS